MKKLFGKRKKVFWDEKEKTKGLGKSFWKNVWIW